VTNQQNDPPRIGAPLRPPPNQQEFTPHPTWMRVLLAAFWIVGLLLAGATMPHIASDELAELYAMVTSLTVRVAILERGQAHTDAVVHRYINRAEEEEQP